jgi:N-acetylglucosamine-6-sulfatase
MGHEQDDPRPGFDHWASFMDQGDYLDPVLNINGNRKQFKGYTTDILTDHALEWLRAGRNERRPFLSMPLT